MEVAKKKSVWDKLEENGARHSFRCIVGKQVSLDATNTATLIVYNQTLVQCEHKS